MALGGGVPPWLNVGPTDYLHAIQAGTNTGLQVAEAQNRAQAAIAARVLAQQQQAQRAWEFGENMRQQAEENARQERYQTGMLDWHRQQLEEQARRNALQDVLEGGKFEETKRHNLATEGISQDKADRLGGEARLEEDPSLPGYIFNVNPSGSRALVKRPANEQTAQQKADLMLRGLHSLQQSTFERATDPLYQMRTNYVLGTLLPQLQGSAQEAAPPMPTDEPTEEELSQIPIPATIKGGRVRVKSPEGKIGTIPAESLDEALAAGYTRL